MVSMADDNTIIEGTVKFRDGKKWKSRWCVMRKLSPVADCVHLQLYRDARERWVAAGGSKMSGGGGSGCKASLSLQQYVGSESGFTLDKHSNTLALLCRDLIVLLAFDTRERLIQWQVKVQTHLSSSRQYLVLVSAATSNVRARLPAGPARLHVADQRFALTAGVPPRLLGVWELQHLRRYGVVENRFCFEGGSHCEKGKGLHVLITDQAHEITDTVDLAAQGKLIPKKRHLCAKKSEAEESPKSHKAYRPETQLSELHERCLPPTGLPLYLETACDVTWPSTEHTLGLGDATSVYESATGTSSVSLARCRSCMSTLGALTRSSTAALTPGARHFSPNWIMESVTETPTNENLPSSGFHAISRSISSERCRCREKLPDQPPKPMQPEVSVGLKLPMPLPGQAFWMRGPPTDDVSRASPYENYDVPKLPSAEVDGEYYDTPKKLKEYFYENLFKISKSSTPNTLILKKPCGCLLKFGRKKREPTVIDTDEKFKSADCPCQWVTNWANNWIQLPFCKRNVNQANDISLPNKENLRPKASDQTPLYAKIDLSRKTRRKDLFVQNIREPLNVDSPMVDIDDGPLTNYKNLNFALSLERYESAKDLLNKAEVTQDELNTTSANLKPVNFAIKDGKFICTKCGHPKKDGIKDKNGTEEPPLHSNEDYLIMEPNNLENKNLEQIGNSLSSSYTPMSPIGVLTFHTLKHPAKIPTLKLLDEKSASNPTLCGDGVNVIENNIDFHVAVTEVHVQTRLRNAHRHYNRKRSSSADSSWFLDDVKEFKGGAFTPHSSSSIETLCNLEVEASTSPCDCQNNFLDANSLDTGGELNHEVRRSISVPSGVGCRDSSGSNDSGVSSCSLRAGTDFELSPTMSASRCHVLSARGRGGCRYAFLPCRSRSTDPLIPQVPTLQCAKVPSKSSSAEAEVPVLSIKQLGSVADSHSTSSGTSDMSDYIETLSLCSSHSSTDTPITMRVMHQTTNTLRPRSGKEYFHLDLRITRSYQLPAQNSANEHYHNYTNLPP